jgi:cyanophycinase-like exopeptidase
MLLLFVWSCVFPAFAAKQYSYFRVGNPNDVTTATTAGTALEGGGTDVDAVYQWMCQRSGNGDFLVIRATGTDAYNPYIQQLCPNENSVATLIIPNRTAASDPFVATTIQNAEALFIAGGDQSDYINFWKGTPVEAALNNLIARNVPIGGTSAGMNVLSQFIYSALASQGVTSSQALANPFTKYIALDENFVNISTVQGVIDDPHFVTRDRMGRDLASSAASISTDGPAFRATSPSTNKPRSWSTPPATARWSASAPSTSYKLPARRKSARAKPH